MASKTRRQEAETRRLLSQIILAPFGVSEGEGQAAQLLPQQMEALKARVRRAAKVLVLMQEPRP